MRGRAAGFRLNQRPTGLEQNFVSKIARLPHAWRTGCSIPAKCLGLRRAAHQWRSVVHRLQPDSATGAPSAPASRHGPACYSLQW